MEIEDFYKIIAKLEKEQERLAKLQAEIVEKITVTNTTQNKDLVKISNNQDILIKQLNNLSTSKNGSNSPELTKALNTIHLDLNRIEEARNQPTFHFWCVVVLIMVLFGIVEYQIHQLPKQTSEQLYQTYYAQQSKPSKSHSK